jgi:prepilin-type N-terminal cleavage/methylation domain-containing protein
MSRRIARRRRSAGYTMVELMMSLALFAVGVLGVISMQKISITSNAHAKNLAIAQRIAQTWSSQLQMDSSAWRTTFDASGVLEAPTAAWRRPAYKTGRVGAAFDALGKPLTDSELAQARFCVHTRFTWLFNSTGVSNNGVVRAEIRVFWLRDGQRIPATIPSGLCGAQDAAQVKTIGEAVNNYHVIYQTVGLRQRSEI